MSYNPENYRRIRQEYEQKYRQARAEAEAHTAAAEEKVPGVREINRTLSGTGLEIFRLSIEIRDDAARLSAIGRLQAANRELIRKRTALLTEAGYPGDYCDVHYACTACNDSGFLDNGSMCDCMRRTLTEEDYRTSGLAEFGDRMTFENFSLQYYKSTAESLSVMTRVAAYIAAYAKNFSLGDGEKSPAPSLLFVGKTGLGKTHLSVALGLAVQKKGYDVQYVSAPDLFAAFEAERFGSGSGMETLASRRFFDCEFLIIDDLGCELTNQFTVSCLYNIINSRLNRRRPTLITTNLFPAELRDRYWDRIASRLTGEYQVLGFSGTDIREQKLHTSR